MSVGVVHAWAGVPPALPANDPILEARDAYAHRDAARLASVRATMVAAGHPLAQWADYWDLTLRLTRTSPDEIAAFDARWPGSYVEDRLRNDWLLELGHRRDWQNFAAEYPNFRMNDDRSVACYALLTDHLAGREVGAAAASAAWLAQKDDDEGCATMAATLLQAQVLAPRDVWKRARLATDGNRPRAARQAVALLDPAAGDAVQAVFDSPSRYLAKKADTSTPTGAELTTLALVRLAADDPTLAAAALRDRWERALPAGLASWAWSAVGKQAAIKLLPEAPDAYTRAGLLAADPKAATIAATVAAPTPVFEGADDALAWQARAALRANDGRGRWQQVIQAINAMPPAEQQEAAWVYWKARALQALAGDSQDGGAMRDQAATLLGAIAGQLTFYGRLAAETLAAKALPITALLALPPRPAPLSVAERTAAADNPGLGRALLLLGVGLRGEGVREWNYTLRGMGDRALLAAAQLACDRQIWDRCISTSERTRQDVDMAQRYPTPYRAQVLARCRAIGLDPAYTYGLIRQESRFIVDSRSAVGAGGLMQIMPSTASWTAHKLGVAYRPGQLMDRDTNIVLGTGYLKLVLDDFGGSQALAAAAYNAGPGRPRRWSAGPTMDVAAWAENIPFTETRDYVKKVLANAAYYEAVLGDVGADGSARDRDTAAEAAPGHGNGNGHGHGDGDGHGDGQSGKRVDAAVDAHAATLLTSRLARPVGPRDTVIPDAYKDLP